MNKKELWLNLANYHFDNLVPTHLWDEIVAQFGGQSPFTKAFADKLSRKLQWKKSFALKAIWEYKKFVYLGVVSDFSVTPSKIIDQVWHEHLLFSAGYRKFCKEVIQHEFDHNPELVSVDSQTEAFQAQYFHTIELYRREFGMEPPADIWGATKFKESPGKKKKAEKKGVDAGYSDTYAGSDTLVSMFSSDAGVDGSFDGGAFGGSGAGGDWGDGGSDGSDGGDSGGDGGSSCSSCSSGCGGD